MAKELYINGQLVDLNEKDSPIAITFAVNDIAELKDREVIGTKTFKVPVTENNRRILGFADSDAWTQDQPYHTLHAKIVQNGVEILPNGVAVIEEAGDLEYEVQILAGVKGFFAALENKTLQDLKLDDDHVWNIDTVANSQTRTTGYIYPVIDYGALPVEDNKVQISQLRPAVFSSTMVMQIIHDARYSFSGDIFSDERFLNEIIPFAEDKMEHGQAWKDQVADFAVTAYTTLDGDVLSGVSYGRVDFPKHQDWVMTFNNETTDVSNLWNGSTFTSPARIRYHVEVNLQYKTWDIYDSVISFWTGDGTNWTKIDEQPVSRMVEYLQWTTLPFSADILVNTGEMMRVTLRCDEADGRFWFHAANTFIKISVTDFSVLPGQLVQIAPNLPKITQKDFMKDFMQRYGLTPVVDNHSRVINFRSFKELYKNSSKALDWTEKFIPGHRSTFKLGNYGQVNYGRFKEDEGVASDLGTASFQIDNTTLPRSVDVITSVFAATDKVVKLNNRWIAQIKKIEDLEKLEFKIKTEPRVLLNRQVSGTGIVFTEGVQERTPAIVSVPHFIREDMPGLGFEDVFRRYYFELIQYMLRKARKVTREVMLTEADLAGLDFFTPIYDANEAQYYYLNQIIDYIEGEPAKCEFIRM